MLTIGLPRRPLKIVAILSLFIGWHLSAAARLSAQDEEKISRFGEYSGYSQARFDEWHVSSRYLEMRDGVKLAIDIVRPAVDGKPVDEAFPVVWTHSRYHRNPRAIAERFGRGGDIKSMVDVSPDLQRLVKHGYVFAAVGVRGSGASFGRYRGLFSPAETHDAYEVTEWLAAQPWCDGSVGMQGGSYLGMTQYMAASQAPPHLKAIFPNVAGFDLYDIVYPGGVYRHDFVEHWDELTRKLDREWLATPVEPDDENLLQKAVKEHKDNWDVAANYRQLKFRDTRSNGYSYLTHNPAPHLIQINHAQVPAYHWGGWYDVFVTDALIWYANYRGPQKLAIGSWPHAATPDPNVMRERTRLRSAEQHRWFDYWLKGIDNGIMDEPPINISSLNEPGDWEWAELDDWAPSTEDNLRFYFSGTASGSVDSVNDGSLTRSRPDQEAGHDDYEIDFSTTTGTGSRWDNAVGAGAMNYGDLSANDAKCLTYTTPQLDSDLTIIGHPIVTLYVESEARDADFHVVLEEVDANGQSNYVTEGVLRASHRLVDEAPWDNLDLPFQRSFKRDRAKLPSGEVTRLRFDLHPIANVFNEGHRLRVAIMGADKDNTEPPLVPEGTNVTVYRNNAHASFIEFRQP